MVSADLGSQSIHRALPICLGPQAMPFFFSPPKIFSCLSNTVLYNSVSLNQDFSSREEKILTAMLSPCHCPRQTSPYRPFPRKHKQKRFLSTALHSKEKFFWLIAQTRNCIQHPYLWTFKGYAAGLKRRLNLYHLLTAGILNFAGT